VFEQNNTKQHDHVLGGCGSAYIKGTEGAERRKIALVLQLLGKVGVSV
jgi:hypothetical protein